MRHFSLNIDPKRSRGLRVCFGEGSAYIPHVDRQRVGMKKPKQGTCEIVLILWDSMRLFQDSETDVTGLGELSILYHLRLSVSVLHTPLLTSPVSSLNIHLHWTFQPSSTPLREEKGALFLSRPVWWQQQWCEREEHPSDVKPKGP